ncbi:MAG: hypothetical protein CL868_06625 [Cytophagaceae bacterium]|nr:hypothetical protein [Cytophagaceae bacterium]
MKKTYLLALCAMLLVFNSCDFLEDDLEEEEEEFVELPLSIKWTYVGSTGTFSEPYYEFNTAYWNEGSIRFADNSLENGIEWVVMKDLDITGVGNYPLLYNPSASLKMRGDVYSTTVYPEFWVEGINNGILIQGGEGYTPSAYLGTGTVRQGGYVNITDHNAYYISGDFYFVTWVFNDQLNREVSIGVTVSFENVLYGD